MTPLGGNGHIVLQCQVQGSDTRTSAFSINLGSSRLTWTVRACTCSCMQLTCKCLCRLFLIYLLDNAVTSPDAGLVLGCHGRETQSYSAECISPQHFLMHWCCCWSQSTALQRGKTGVSAKC